jgi:ATP-dependent DNA helicase RecG
MTIENAELEFKREFSNDIKIAIIAFANSHGGIIKVGIDDNGEVCGLVDTDETLLQITNSVRDSVMPDITMFINYSISIDNVITINVNEGSNKPYYLKEKGLKPSGVYVRQGASSAQASWEQIRIMIKQTDGDKYENLRSLEQNLTFNSATDEFKKRGIDIDETKYLTLGIKNFDKVFTNLGLLISDQCSHTIKVAVFDSTEKNLFIDRKEFSGSLLKQLHDTYNYLELLNKTHSTFDKLDRIDNRDYSVAVVREALVNAIVHRDYAFSGSIIINVYTDRMEFISLGGIVNGLLKEDILSGISQTRNEKLAGIFYRLKHIESYGYGLPIIFLDYKNEKCLPEIIITTNSFKIILPNKNYQSIANLCNNVRNPNESETQIIKYIISNGSINRLEIERLLSIKQSRAFQIVKTMLNDSMIISTGVGSNKRYKLP